MAMASFPDSLSRSNFTSLLNKCASYIQQPPELPGYGASSSFASIKSMASSSSPSSASSACNAAMASSRSLQHAESLKWQQEVFHRLLHLIFLAREGLAAQDQVDGCRAQILAFLRSSHPDGEWPDFTRDKLLFLQDLLFTACITEEEYHDAKKVLILRLADQGATIEAQDFMFDMRADPPSLAAAEKAEASTPQTKAKKKGKKTKAKAEAEAEGEAHNAKPVVISASSPLKQVIGAMSRISKSPTTAAATTTNASNKCLLPNSPLKIADDHVPCSSPHPLDHLRPEHCPERDPPSPYAQPPISHPKPLDQLSLSKQKQQQQQQQQVEMPNRELAHDVVAADNADLSMNHIVASPRNHHSPSVVCTDRTSDCSSPLDKGSAHKPSSNTTTPSRFKSMISGLIIPKRTIRSGNEPDEEEEHEGEGDGEKLLPSLANSKFGSSRWGIIPGFLPKRHVAPSDAVVVKSLNPHTPAGIESEETAAEKPSGKGKWGLEMFRLPKKLQFDAPLQEILGESELDKTCQETANAGAPPSVIPVDKTDGKGPNAKGLKKKLHSNPDFFIDKVLGENIKNELSRIRAEMNKTQPGQMFTNEQIDAIAARLPMDTAELKKFFPQTWCERYGDIVLEVVQKEFKEHVNDMQKLGKPVKERRAVTSAASSPLKKPNDENMVDHNSAGQLHRAPLRTPDFTKCFSALDENTQTSVLSPATGKQKQQHSPCGNKLIGRFKRDDAAKHADENLDSKREEEVSKMPLQRHNEYGSYLRA